MRRPPRTPRTDRPLVEELESRVLLSADLQPVPLDLPDAEGAGEALVERVELLSRSADSASESLVQRDEVVFVDAGVADREALLADLQRAAGERSLEIVLLDADSDGLRQISDFLADREGLDAVHLISHGQAGSLQLGSTWLDGAGLLARADEVAAWGEALASDADLLLYGCDLASQPEGAALVESLAKLTGADVAASVDPTGDAELGGDWELEYHSGAIEAAAAVDATPDWSGTLANQAPENTVPGTQTTPTDTQLLFSDAGGNGISIDDPDAGDEIIELRIDVTNGTVTLVGPSDPVDVNSETSSVQTTPRVARDADGNTLVVWASQDQDGDGFGIYGQRYDAAGQPLGAEFQINTETLGDQTSPAIAMNASGDFVVVWQSAGQDGDSWGIYAQRFDAAGNPVGGEIQVNGETALGQTAPSVAMDASGDFVVVWQSEGQDGDGLGIFGQRFDAAGNAVGSEFQVSSETANDQAVAAVASNAAGDFVVVWQSLDQDGDSWGIFGQRFDASGVAQGGEFQVSSEVVGEQTRAAIAMDLSGDFVVTWQSLGQDGDSWGIYAQRFDAAGAPQGGEFQVNTTTPQEQSSPAVAMDADGDFAIVWQGGPGNLDIYVQHYTADGVPIGGETRVNAFAGGDQTTPDVAMDADGDHFVVWEGKTGGATNDEIAGSHVSFAKNLSFVTGDGTDDAVIVVRGTLEDLNEALDGMVFTPTAGFEGVATIQITTDDLGSTGGPPLTDTDRCDIIVGDVNAAPVLDPSGDLTLSDVAEDDPDPPGDRVSDLLASAGGDPIRDADGDPEGIAVVGVDDTHGTWQFSIDDGASWRDFGSVSDASAVLLDGGHRIRFVPDADYSGPAGEISFRAWDQTEGSPGDTGHAIATTGGTSAFSDATETASCQVTPANDAPVHVLPGGQTTSEDTDLVFSVAGGNPIRVSDVDADGQDLEMRLTASVGRLSLATTAGLDFVSGDGSDDASLVVRGSLAELNAALDGLRYHPDADWSGSAWLEIETSDLGHSGGASTPALDAIHIAVTPVNDAPTQSVPGPQSIATDASLVFSGSGGNPLLVSDVDASAVQVTLVASRGTVTLGSFAGLSFGAGDGVDDALVTFSGSLADVNAALEGLRFDAAPGFAGTASVTLTTDDLGASGAGGPLSTTGTVPVIVTPGSSQTGTAPPTEEQAPPPPEAPPGETGEPPGEMGEDDGLPEESPTASLPPQPEPSIALEPPATEPPPQVGPVGRVLPPAPAAEPAEPAPVAVAAAEREHGADASERAPGPVVRSAALAGSSGQLDTSLDQLRQDLSRSADDEQAQGETIFAGIRAAALAASTGALAALLRGGSLLALTFSSLPVWKGFDPLAVLALTAAERKARKVAQQAAEEEEDEAVARMFEGD